MIFFFEKNFLEKNSWKYAFIFLEIFFRNFSEKISLFGVFFAAIKFGID